MQRCLRWCDQTYGPGGYRVSLYADPGCPANLHWEPDKKGRHRPGFKTLVASVGEGQLDVVVVSSLDRLSRSALLSHELIDKVLTPHGVRLVEATGGTEMPSLGPLPLPFPKW